MIKRTPSLALVEQVEVIAHFLRSNARLERGFRGRVDVRELSVNALIKRVQQDDLGVR